MPLPVSVINFHAHFFTFFISVIFVGIHVLIIKFSSRAVHMDTIKYVTRWGPIQVRPWTLFEACSLSISFADNQLKRRNIFIFVDFMWKRNIILGSLIYLALYTNKLNNSMRFAWYLLHRSFSLYMQHFKEIGVTRYRVVK